MGHLEYAPQGGGAFPVVGWGELDGVRLLAQLLALPVVEEFINALRPEPSEYWGLDAGAVEARL
jgi:hypothetical protein